MVSLHVEEEQEPNGRYKEPTSRHSLEPQKAHPTGDFVVVT